MAVNIRPLIEPELIEGCKPALLVTPGEPQVGAPLRRPCARCVRAAGERSLSAARCPGPLPQTGCVAPAGVCGKPRTLHVRPHLWGGRAACHLSLRLLRGSPCRRPIQGLQRWEPWALGWHAAAPRLPQCGLGPALHQPWPDATDRRVALGHIDRLPPIPAPSRRSHRVCVWPNWQRQDVGAAPPALPCWPRPRHGAAPAQPRSPQGLCCIEPARFCCPASIPSWPALPAGTRWAARSRASAPPAAASSRASCRRFLTAWRRRTATSTAPCAWALWRYTRWGGF